ncbi:MAG: flavocytochrome c [Burkholderiaceae bacterium]
MTENRRNFMKSMAAATLAVGALPTAQAMPTDQPAKWDEEYDLVVVGSGGAGLAAAAHAAEKGLKVVVLEKMPTIGGSSIICGGGSAFAGTDLQKKQGIKDSADNLYNDIMNVGGKINDPEVVRAFCDAQLEVYNWFMAHGGKYNSEHMTGNVSVRRNVQLDPTSILNGLRDYATKNGVKIMTRTAAERLAYDDKTKTIVGVFAKRGNKTISLRGKRGVLLASGGFARNKKMLAQYVPRMANTLTICGLGSDGDGLKMAQAYGCDIADMPYIKATFAFNTQPTTISDSAYPYWQGGIVVNKAGKRFVNESIPKKDVGDHVLEQEGGIGYCIYDEPIRQESLKTMRNNGSVRQSEERGLVFKGDTIAEAAKKAGLDPAVVEATVAQYNKDVGAGKDSIFGRTNQAGKIGDLLKIENGPFYIFPGTAVLLATYCGVKINGKTEVIDVFGNKIKGLYAAGEVTGGFHGKTYMSATAFNKGLVFGYIAADSVLKS